MGIDVFTGPSEFAIIADDSADPMTIAVDLVSQAEHGYDSPVWLFTTSRRIGEKVEELMPMVAAEIPNPEVVQSAWDTHCEIIFCESREECVQVSDEYASEHLQILTQDTNWWRDNLKNYGSLFLREGETDTHGVKCSGTNHVVPTKRIARYSGRLNAHKFLKILTYQEISEEANPDFTAVGSRIYRVGGMDGYVRACDWRLR